MTVVSALLLFIYFPVICFPTPYEIPRTAAITSIVIPITVSILRIFFFLLRLRRFLLDACLLVSCSPDSLLLSSKVSPFYILILISSCISL